jgi:hypothetical protein
VYICCIFVGLLTVNWEELISRAKLWGQVVGVVVAGRMLMGTPHKVPGSVDALQGGFSRMEKHEKKLLIIIILLIILIIIIIIKTICIYIC